MKKIIHLLAFLSMISFTACEDVVFLPIEGTIEGTVTDNNGAALEGVQGRQAQSAAAGPRVSAGAVAYRSVADGPGKAVEFSAFA